MKNAISKKGYFKLSIMQVQNIFKVWEKTSLIQQSQLQLIVKDINVNDTYFNVFMFFRLIIGTSRYGNSRY